MESKNKIILNNDNWTLPSYIGHNPLEELDLPKEIKSILFRRGFKSSDQVKKFLTPIEDRNAYEHFPYLEKAIQRLRNACIKKEKVAICGDYDADGMTSSALLMSTLRELEAQPINFIPSRVKEGYGLNVRMINEIDGLNIKIIVTVDNGVNSSEALELANKLNIDVIITDHHEYKVQPKNILSLIHPLTTPVNSCYRGIAGVGAAYILAYHLSKTFNKNSAIKIATHLFTIGTIADMSPLTGQNRCIVMKGLKDMHNTNCIGLKALIKICGLEHRIITAQDIGFKIAPRINAVGRIGNPKLIVDLLTELDHIKAEKNALECEELNEQRRNFTNQIEQESIQLLDKDIDSLPSFILLAQSHWHVGVIGIVASRLVERYKRPVALLSIDENGLFRGSARAPSNFSIINTLHQCSNYLEGYGGHKAAAGFTIRPEKISSFNKQLQLITDKYLINNVLDNSIKPDVHLDLNRIEEDFMKKIELLEPFGIGNLKPIFWTRKCIVKSQRKLKGEHLKVRLLNNNKEIEGIYWNYGKKIINHKIVDIAYNLERNFWNNKHSIQLNLLSIRPYNNQVKLNFNNREYICQINEDNYLVIINKKGEIIKASIDNNKVKLLNSFKEGNIYIVNLLNKAGIALGIID